MQSNLEEGVGAITPGLLEIARDDLFVRLNKSLHGLNGTRDNGLRIFVGVC